MPQTGSLTQKLAKEGLQSNQLTRYIPHQARTSFVLDQFFIPSGPCFQSGKDISRSTKPLQNQNMSSSSKSA